MADTYIALRIFHVAAVISAEEKKEFLMCS
jgi:hypothetical protein